MRSLCSHACQSAHLLVSARLVTNVRSQRDGYVFGLRPRSRVWLEEQYPDRQRVASVFIGLDKMQDINLIHESVLEQVLLLLTGLSLKELETVGGFTIFDPRSRQEIVHSASVHV